eukprot:scaffold82682_cov35-Tisochrysis_lutea.AAC.3
MLAPPMGSVRLQFADPNQADQHTSCGHSHQLSLGMSRGRGHYLSPWRQPRYSGSAARERDRVTLMGTTH